MSEIVTLVADETYNLDDAYDLLRKDPSQETILKALFTLADKKSETDHDVLMFDQLVSMYESDEYVELLKRVLANEHKPYIDIISASTHLMQSYVNLAETTTMINYLQGKIDDQNCTPFKRTLELMNTPEDQWADAL